MSDRHARVGKRRRLLPGLPRPLRAERPGRGARVRSSRGTRRPTIHGFKGGDLYGVADRLDYLQDLGITALYLNPVFASASNHRYHTYDYLAVDPLLGGDDALRGLLDAAHARGMKVVLDGVFNHASRGFWPFNHVLECGLGSPYVDWFHVDRDALAAGRPLRAYPNERPPRSTRRAGAPAGADHVGERVDARPSATRHGGTCRRCPSSTRTTPKVREYIFGVAEHWIRFGADGWRLDVAAEIDDDDVLARVPPPREGDRPRGVHRRGDLARGPSLAPGRPVRRAT